jgi:hypothetical protein
MAGAKARGTLSPLLFVLAIEPVQHIRELSTHHENLHKIRGRETAI